jgi:hypothetical protein
MGIQQSSPLPHLSSLLLSHLLHFISLPAAAVIDFSDHFPCPFALLPIRNLKMTKARETMKDNKASMIPYLGNWAKKFCSSATNLGLTWGSWVRHSEACWEMQVSYLEDDVL